LINDAVISHLCKCPNGRLFIVIVELESLGGKSHKEHLVDFLDGKLLPIKICEYLGAGHALFGSFHCFSGRRKMLFPEKNINIILGQ
jgi:hypothetical protein